MKLFFSDKFTREVMFLLISVTIAVLLPSVAAYAADACSLSIADSWRDKFPFDIIVGSVGTTNYFDTCPEFLIFGESFKACSFKTVADLVKNIFIIRVAISALINL